MIRSLIVAVVLGLLVTVVHADNWPQWRGIHGDGISLEKNLPVEWAADKNMLWSVPLPGMAGSTPCVWGDKLFLSTESKDGLNLVCINATDGKEVWNQPISTKKSRRARSDEGNSASASPCTDGKHVYVFVGTGEFACYDFAGKEVWKFDAQERYGKFNIQFGHSSTPVLHDGKLFWQRLDTNAQQVVCIDAATGKDLWVAKRASDGTDENEHSYASPQLWKKGDAAYLVVHGNDYTTAHDLKDGHEIWRLSGLNPKEKYNRFLRFVASPVVTPDLIIVPTAKNGPVVAIKPTAQGKIEEGSSYEQWRRTRETPDVPCPLVHDGLVYLCRENGVLICIDAETGKEYYNQRIHSARYRASPVYADGKIYCTARDGVVSVFEAGKTFKKLSENKLPDQMSASPVIANGRIYLRGFEKLYCVGTSAK
jgi:outer membrane protein assembly factor BamB